MKSFEELMVDYDQSKYGSPREYVNLLKEHTYADKYLDRMIKELFGSYLRHEDVLENVETYKEELNGNLTGYLLAYTWKKDGAFLKDRQDELQKQLEFLSAIQR